jgi:16S rRNA (guanine(966)-N(2))-methyltransferase RsmD
MKQSKPHKGIRPTSSRVREALFDILRARIRGAVVLDLYAGTGAVGFEALREGASSVYFVEGSRAASAKIEQYIETKGLSDRASIVMKKAAAFPDWAEDRGLGFDIIFLDPPYHTDETEQILAALGDSSLLNEGGVVIAEHFEKKNLPEVFGTLQKVKDYRYGDTMLSFFEEAQR